MLPESDGHVSIVCLVNGWVRTVSIDGTCCITLRTLFFPPSSWPTNRLCSWWRRICCKLSNRISWREKRCATPFSIPPLWQMEKCTWNWMHLWMILRQRRITYVSKTMSCVQCAPHCQNRCRVERQNQRRRWRKEMGLLLFKTIWTSTFCSRYQRIVAFNTTIALLSKQHQEQSSSLLCLQVYRTSFKRPKWDARSSFRTTTRKCSQYHIQTKNGVGLSNASSPSRFCTTTTSQKSHIHRLLSKTPH